MYATCATRLVSPSQGRFVYIIDESHAFHLRLQCFIEDAEEPSHVIFILATTEIHKIPATVLSAASAMSSAASQCKPSSKSQAAHQTGKHQIDDDALSLVARQATGSLRDAISLVDQLARSHRGSPKLPRMSWHRYQSGSHQLVDAIIKKEHAVGLEIIHKALDSGSDPFARQIVDYLRNLLVIKLEGGKSLELPEVRKQMNDQSENSPPLSGRHHSAFSNAATDLKANCTLAWLKLAYSAQSPT